MRSFKTGISESVFSLPKKSKHQCEHLLELGNLIADELALSIPSSIVPHSHLRTDHKGAKTEDGGTSYGGLFLKPPGPHLESFGKGVSMKDCLD